MADALQEITIFARIVGTGSLSAAARDLGMSPALVSRNLASLEARLGVRLINRTTRSLHLTDEGAAYYETCTRVLAEIEEADAAVSAGRAEPLHFCAARSLVGAAGRPAAARRPVFLLQSTAGPCPGGRNRLRASPAGNVHMGVWQPAP